MSVRILPTDYADLETLWLEFQAAIIVSWRVSTPEVRAEMIRAKEALLQAVERHKPDSS